MATSAFAFVKAAISPSSAALETRALGHHAVVQVHDQGRRARDEIAEIVREVRVEPADQGLLREVGVEPEDHLAQDEVAERVVAVLLLERERLDQVADGLEIFWPPSVQ